jgi:dynein heavy chain 1
VEAISRDLNEQLLRVLGSQRLMFMEYAAFERAMAACAAVFHAWDDSLKEFTNIAREVTRKRTEKFLPIKIIPAQAKLQERITYLRQFRKQHHQLEVMVGPLGNESRRLADGVERVALRNDIDMEAEVCHLRFKLSNAQSLMNFDSCNVSGTTSIRECEECRCPRSGDW